MPACTFHYPCHALFYTLSGLRSLAIAVRQYIMYLPQCIARSREYHSLCCSVCCSLGADVRVCPSAFASLRPPSSPILGVFLSATWSHRSQATLTGGESGWPPAPRGHSVGSVGGGGIAGEMGARPAARHADWLSWSEPPREPRPSWSSNGVPLQEVSCASFLTPVLKVRM
jgi:hypothetical protein